MDHDADLDEFLAEADRLNINGLLFQHIQLCQTRTWLHYHRIDCAHLNRHMQSGLLLHETSYGGAGQSEFGYGIAPDMIDWPHFEISEIKQSRSREDAAILQLQFYLAIMIGATGRLWSGVLRYPRSRRVKKIVFDDQAKANLLAALQRIKTVLSLPCPPAKEPKPLCQHCAYRLLCWGKSTEDGDY